MEPICRIFINIVVVISVLSLPITASCENVDSILRVLDAEILRYDEYKAIKEARLDSLKKNISSSSDPRYKYEVSSKLYEEYKKYQFDSTYCYANRMLEYARLMDDPEAIAHAKCNLIFCQISAGFYMEAWQIINDFDLTGLSTVVKQEFYSRSVLFYQNLSFYAKGVGNLGETYDAKRREAVNQ